MFQTADLLWVFYFINPPFVFRGLFLALFLMQQKAFNPVSVLRLDYYLPPHTQLFH